MGRRKGGSAIFNDREDAGRRLARALEHYRDQNVLVLAIPRGGVEVAYYVARHINGELSILVSRKLPHPHNPEAGFGAIAEDGSTFIFPGAERWLSRDAVARISEEQIREIQRRIRALRGGKPLPPIAGRTVILADDGLAMGSTMRAAIMLCRNQKAAKVIVAVPVAGPETAREVAAMADELVVLETPAFFQAVAQVYRNWYDVPDEDVLAIMARWEKEKGTPPRRDA